MKIKFKGTKNMFVSIFQTRVNWQACIKEIHSLNLESTVQCSSLPSFLPCSYTHELPDLRSPPLTDLGRGLGARGGGGLGLRAVITGLVLGLGPGGHPEQTHIIRQTTQQVFPTLPFLITTLLLLSLTPCHFSAVTAQISSRLISSFSEKLHMTEEILLKH